MVRAQGEKPRERNRDASSNRLGLTPQSDMILPRRGTANPLIEPTSHFVSAGQALEARCDSRYTFLSEVSRGCILPTWRTSDGKSIPGVSPASLEWMKPAWFHT